MSTVETALWSRCLRQLEAEVPEQLFNVWVRPLQAVEEDGVLRLLAPNRFVVDWVRHNLLERIAELVRGSLDGGSGEAPHIMLEVGTRPLRDPLLAGLAVGDAGQAPVLDLEVQLLEAVIGNLQKVAERDIGFGAGHEG